jgi:signal transduction histidine kinase
VLARLRDELGPRLRAAGGELAIGGELPPTAGDQELCETILRVLLSNAIDYRERARPLRIEVRGRVVRGREVELEVADNGVGIPAEDQEKIFRPFQRLVSDEVVPGTGIGLALARKAARLQRGSLAVESQPGAGSRFVVRLPLAGGHDEERGSA